MILSKARPLIANSPYLTTSAFFFLTIVFKLIHRGTPETISNKTLPRLHTSMTQGLLYFCTYSSNFGMYSNSFSQRMKLSISGAMYSGVAMENCRRLLKTKELPQSINLVYRMWLPSLLQRCYYYVLRRTRMFSVFRSEWTMLFQESSYKALATSRMIFLIQFWLFLSLVQKSLQWMRYIFSLLYGQLFNQYRAFPNESPHFSYRIHVSFLLMKQQQSLTRCLMPALDANSSLGAPPNQKKQVPNQISFMWVWWLLYVIICFIAYFFFDFLCQPNQTREKPPRPNRRILSKPQGKRSPKVQAYSRLRSKGFFFFFYHRIYIFYRDSSLSSLRALFLSGRGCLGVLQLLSCCFSRESSLGLAEPSSKGCFLRVFLISLCLFDDESTFLRPSSKFSRLSETYFSSAVFLNPERCDSCAFLKLQFLLLCGVSSCCLSREEFLTPSSV